MVGTVFDLQTRRLMDTRYQLAAPQSPTKLWPVASADLPPAADWQYHQCYVTDKTCVAVSTGSSWVRADGSAL